MHLRWLALERKFAFEKIDASVLSEEGWQQSPANSEIFRGTETFITLLQSLTARFKLIRSDVKLNFLELQCELIEDFRMRLVQLLRQEKSLPISDKYSLALNSAKHLVQVLSGWSDLPLFLHLAFLMKSEDENGVFANVIDGLNFFLKDSMENLAIGMTYEVKARSLQYKNLNWINFQPLGDDSPCPEALGMFQALAAQLNAISLKLNEDLASSVVTKLGLQLGEFFLHEIILENMFDQEGIKQLGIDIEKGLLPTLGQHSMQVRNVNHEILGLKLAEAMKLLEMKSSNAKLLNETLLHGDKNADLNQSKDILKEFDVATLSGTLARRILSKRTDL